jgi:hypothetical protein
MAKSQAEFVVMRMACTSTVSFTENNDLMKDVMTVLTITENHYYP